MAKRYLITSALLYANGPLHFGHIAGAYLPADVFARFQRMKGSDVLYVCGSDEYGIAITLSAEKAQRSPQEHVNIFHEINQKLFEKLKISFNHYSRTTWKGHDEVVLQFFQDLYDNGHIEEKEEEHLFSEKEQRFLADRYVVGTCPKCGYDAARGDECPKCGASYEATDLKNPRSQMTQSALGLKKSLHWYLRFDHFKEALQTWMKEKNWRPNVFRFAMGYVDDLKARGITRDSNWGIPVPLKNAKGKVFYVWFDAPIGYISASKEWAQKNKNPDEWKKYWLDLDTKLVHFIGKDNIPFHAVFFPAMIMGQNTKYKLVDDIPANEFYLLEGKKFSKSDGWYIEIEDFLKQYSIDQIRYTLAANAPETSDSEFSFKDFQMRCNAELLGKLGNFVHRTLIFAEKNCSQMIPDAKEWMDSDKKFLKEIDALVEDIAHSYESYSIRKAASHIMELAAKGNIYFDFKKPWLLKKEGKIASMNTTIYLCLECIKRLAIVSSPIIPDAAEQIWKFLGYTEKPKWDHEPLKSGTQLLKAYPIFRKIEDEEIEMEIAKLGTPLKKSNFPPLKDTIEFDQFQNLDLRVAQVIRAENVPKSKKLLKVVVDLGFEKRTIVSGIAEHYKPEELLGKKLLIVANLKPVKIMGIESQGMILTAALNEDIELPCVEKVLPGADVT